MLRKVKYNVNPPQNSAPPLNVNHHESKNPIAMPNILVIKNVPDFFISWIGSLLINDLIAITI